MGANSTQRSTGDSGHQTALEAAIEEASAKERRKDARRAARAAAAAAEEVKEVNEDEEVKEPLRKMQKKKGGAYETEEEPKPSCERENKRETEEGDEHEEETKKQQSKGKKRRTKAEKEEETTAEQAEVQSEDAEETESEKRARKQRRNERKAVKEAEKVAGKEAVDPEAPEGKENQQQSTGTSSKPASTPGKKSEYETVACPDDVAPAKRKKRKTPPCSDQEAEESDEAAAGVREPGKKRRKGADETTQVEPEAAPSISKVGKKSKKLALSSPTDSAAADPPRTDLGDVSVWDGETCSGVKPWARFEDVGTGAGCKVVLPGRAVDFLRREKGFKEPTVIQAFCWPVACQARDLIGIAKTGSGKTLAYLLPALPRILASKDRARPQVLVLAPTRELALQIEQEAEAFRKCLGIQTVCVYGGASKGPQIGALRRGADAVVATAGRLNDFLETNVCNRTGNQIVDLSSATYLVLDEADRMLDMGFEPQIRKIFAHLPVKRQTLLFSATWPKEIRALAAEFLTNPVHVQVGTTDAFQGNGDVEQRVVLLDEAEMKNRVKQKLLGGADPELKWKELRRILKDHAGQMCLVFCAMKKTAALLADELWKEGVAAVGLHGDMDQWGREAALRSFKEGESKVLVATDVAARGLDVQGIAVVVNYDPAGQVDDHVHRIGRTGRAGKKGVAYTLLGKSDADQAKDIVKVMRSAGQAVPAELEELANWQVPGASRKAWRNARWWGPKKPDWTKW